MNEETAKERIFLFGNGATLACDPGIRYLLKWGILRLTKTHDNTNAQNIKEQLQCEFDAVFSTLQQLFCFTNKNRKSGEKNIEKFKHIHDQYQEYILRKSSYDNLPQLSGFMKKYDCNAISHYIFERAYDTSEGGYGSRVQKKICLIGELSGSVIEILSNLQTHIVSLFCLSYQNQKTNYDKFIQLLSKEPIKKVISLNWDNLYEQSFRRVNRQSEPFHVFIPNQMAFDINKNAHIAKDFLLLKPHGSLEYYCCQSLAHQDQSGCFRITVAPGKIVTPWASSPEHKCLFYRKSAKCQYYFNLQPFVHPYTRVERSFRAIPFIRMALEAAKNFLNSNYELTVIGYSFSGDRNGWIDYDLLPIFLRASRIKLISLNTNEGAKIKDRILKEIPKADTKIEVTKYKGFEDYINQSMIAGHLL